MNWQVVKNKTQFEQALAEAKTTGQPIIVDLYADWSIACQPIERNIWTNPDVQQSLKNVQKIKLDLSEFDASHQVILNEWQMLG
ncbi:thiol:disulfide interchange protein, partial [Enterococcus faecium]